ncbi:MAG: PAS domain-containing protein [Daejeonella sp.]
MSRGLVVQRFIILLILFLSVSFSNSFGQSSQQGKPLDITKQDTNRVNYLNTLAYQLTVSNLLLAEKYQQEALKLSEKLDYKKGIVWAYYLQGIIYTYRDGFVMAIEAESDGVKLAVKINQPELIARCYNVIGLCNVRLEDDYNALLAFKKALAAVQRSSQKSFEPAIIHNIASLNSKQGNYKQALKKFNIAVKLNLASNNKEWLAQNYLEIGETYEKTAENELAEIYALKAIDLAKEVKFNRAYFQSLGLLGTIYLNKGKYAKSEKYLFEGLKNVDISSKKENLKFYQKISRLYVEQNKYQKAYEYKSLYADLYDSLYNAGRNRLILEYQEKFNSDQNIKENELLRKEKVFTQSEIDHKDFLLYLFVGTLLVSVIVLSVLIWGNRKIRVNNNLLRARNQIIKTQKDNVEHLNHIKDKLFSVIAHDLRSPFANMINMIELYEDGMISKDEIDFFFKEIRKDIGSNSLLLENLLMWAKSQLAGFKIVKVPVEISKIVDELTLLNKKNLMAKNIILENEVVAEDIVDADYEMIKTILRNLIGNAIKFTPKNGKILISSKNLGDTVEIAVKDSGIGICEEIKNNLFDETFFTTIGLNKEKGTGLGLQICKEFIAKNQGELRVESEEKIGSTFYFTLPRSSTTFKELAGSENHKEDSSKKSFKEIIKNNISQQFKFDRYELLAKATNDTVWDWDLINNEISWNEALFSNFGYPLEKTDMEWWAKMIHPEDLQAVETSIQEALDSKQDKWEQEYRFLSTNGIYKYIYDRGLIIFDDNRVPIRMIGVMQNTTDLKNATHEVERLSLVAKNVNNLVLITDADDNLVWVNTAFEKFTGYQLSEVKGQSPISFLRANASDQNNLQDLKNLMERNEPFCIEVINYKKSGEPYWVQIDCASYKDPITQQMGYLSIQTIITERKENELLILRKNKAFQEIARISSHDVRNPLASILGLVHLLGTPLTTDEKNECMRLLNQSAQNLDSLIHKIHEHIRLIDLQDESTLSHFGSEIFKDQSIS